MADYPHGAQKLPNGLTTAPGYLVENVFVMAGIPAAMRAMLAAASHELPQYQPIEIYKIIVKGSESLISKHLANIQAEYADVALGSYPHYIDQEWHITLTAKSNNPSLLTEVEEKLKKMVANLNLPVVS